jgi:hypothetical protein
MLMVCALLAHLLKYNEHTVHEGPSIFTTAGIFFTFLGIAEGLYEFDPKKIDASIPALLDGLKTAFWSTSLRYLQLETMRYCAGFWLASQPTVSLPPDDCCCRTEARTWPVHNVWNSE